MKALLGNWRRILLAFIVASIAVVPLTGCVVHDDDHDHWHDHDHDWHDDHPDHP